jgi:hypothetical protein
VVAPVAVTVDSVDLDFVNLGSMVLVAVAEGGEIGSGGFDLDDAGAATTVPALKDATVTDTRATPDALWSGRTGERGRARGEQSMVADDDRVWDVMLLDQNALLDDIVLTGSGANRPAETDYARVTWLITQLATYGVSAGVVPNTNTVNLDAQDYRNVQAGPRQVLSDCGEAAQKNYFLYDHGSGIKVYYDKHTGSSLASTAKLSTVLADVDDSTVFNAIDCHRVDDPTNVYSAVAYQYQGGTVQRDASDTGLTTEADYRYRKTAVQDDRVKSSTTAQNKADKYLYAASSETATFTCGVIVPAANVNDIREGHRIQVKVPHLDYSVYTWFRITRREVRAAPAQHGATRTHYALVLTFASDVKMTNFNSPRPPSSEDSGGTTDGSAITLARYQLADEVGSGYFGPFAGLWDNVGSSFSFGTISAAVDGIVDESPEGNIAWPYTDCGVGTGGVAGLATREVWHRFTIDLSAGDVVGVRVTVAAFLSTGSGYTLSPGGFLVGDDTVIVGIHTGTSSSGAEVTDKGQYTEVGRVGSAGGEVVIPASLLIDVTAGYCWIVLAPGWVISSDLFFCNSAGNKPWGYGKTGHDSNGSSIVSAVPVTYSGTGTSPWLPAIGDVDGSNDTFDLPLWNGTGTPEIRVGVVVLGPGEYTVDSGLLQATLVVPPPADMAGQVAYRAKTG